MATALFFHAHPDDEAISTGGTMARLAAEGHRVVLVTATAGELGEVPDGYLDPGETLVERRRRELAAACDALGVARHEYLGYRDSGMEGEASNNDPESFWQADVQEAGARLAAILSAEEADVIVDYDERGIYGHPDHVQVHRVGACAAALAGVPRRYMATANRDHLLSLAQLAEAEGIGVEGPPQDLIDILGVHEDRITTAVDVSAYLDRKRSAMAAHGSQISDTSFFLAMDEPTFAAVWGIEWFIRPGVAGGKPFETTIVPNDD